MSRFEIMRSYGVEFRNCDARNFSDIANVFNEFKPTRVVHLAAIASSVEAGKILENVLIYNCPLYVMFLNFAD